MSLWKGAGAGGIAGVPSTVLLPPTRLALPILTLGSPGPPSWAPCWKNPSHPPAECTDGKGCPLCFVLCCRKDTHPSHWYPACLARRRAGSCPSTTPHSNEPFPSWLKFLIYVCLHFRDLFLYKGHKWLNFFQTLRTQESTCLRLHQVGRGYLCPMCAGVVLEAPLGHDSAPTPRILFLAGVLTLSPSEGRNIGQS